MGITYADLRLANDARDDLEEINANAVVDRGALHLCIPEHIATQLQLKARSQREVQTADGKSHMVDYVSPVRISMLGRECTTGALVIGNQVLLGAIPMEDMDLNMATKLKWQFCKPFVVSLSNHKWLPERLLTLRQAQGERLFMRQHLWRYV